jgi:hypothetical protein
VHEQVKLVHISINAELYMVFFNVLRRFPFACLLSAPVAVALIFSVAGNGWAQSIPTAPALTDDAPPVDPVNPDNIEDLRPLSQDGSLLSMRSGQRLIEEAATAVAAQNYTLAISKLQDARQLFNQLSNFYQELYSSFNPIDNRIADVQRRQALESAQMRDEATYQLALVHRARNQPDLAVPLLIQIVRSQNPTRDLGQRAYRQLFELGFVDTPYPRNQEPAPTSTAPTAPSN